MEVLPYELQRVIACRLSIGDLVRLGQTSWTLHKIVKTLWKDVVPHAIRTFTALESIDATILLKSARVPWHDLCRDYALLLDNRCRPFLKNDAVGLTNFKVHPEYMMTHSWTGHRQRRVRGVHVNMTYHADTFDITHYVSHIRNRPSTYRWMVDDGTSRFELLSVVSPDGVEWSMNANVAHAHVSTIFYNMRRVRAMIPAFARVTKLTNVNVWMAGSEDHRDNGLMRACEINVYLAHTGMDLMPCILYEPEIIVLDTDDDASDPDYDAFDPDEELSDSDDD